ncbi:MAG: L-threonylcarbamoyladenylate synthase [Patescibacteria group bacterium]|jgi:L-threonylcarbamoyladenylate synthase
MKIVKPNKIGVQQAVKILKNGGVIIYPTDTAYALGGIFDSKKVTQKILKIKNRKDKKFTLIASSLKQVEKFFKLNSSQKKLARNFWPGPLSIVVSPRFAVRVPKNRIVQSLAQQVGKPIIATSANLSGQPTLFDSKKIIAQFQSKKNTRLNLAGQKPDLLIDSGRLAQTKTSTVVKVVGNKAIVLRSGAVKIES